MYRVDELQEMFENVAVEIPGHGYHPARPLSGTFRWGRLRDAWAVLAGRADAVIWPEDYLARR